jgi:hypothetical protein
MNEVYQPKTDLFGLKLIKYYLKNQIDYNIINNLDLTLSKQIFEKKN